MNFMYSFVQILISNLGVNKKVGHKNICKDRAPHLLCEVDLNSRP